MNKKIFTLLIALTVLLGGVVNAQVFSSQKKGVVNNQTSQTSMTKKIVNSQKTDLVVGTVDKTVESNYLRNNSKGDITIGTGTLLERYPIYAFFGYSYTQSIYLQSEIGSTPSFITHIKYYFNGTSLASSNNWTIYIGHTTKSTFASASDWEPVAGLTQVYSSIITSPTGPGWIEFDITDFQYNGVDNLVIAVDENASGYDGSSDKFYASAVTGNRSLVAYSDDNNPDPASPPAAGYNQAIIPNIILTTMPAAGANITFTATEGATPLQGVAINCGGADFITDAAGQAVIYLPVGNIGWTADMFGYTQSTGTVTVVDGVAGTVAVSMVALPTFNANFLIKDVPGNIIPGAAVTIYSGTNIVAQGVTDVNGAYTNTLPNGSYTFDIVVAGYASVIGEALVIAGADVNITKNLTEVMVDPYGLLVNVTGKNAAFSWNNSLGFSDDFESYVDFSLIFAPWILNDVDGGATYHIGSGTVNGFPGQDSPMAGIIFNPSSTTPTPLTGCDAHSGSKYVAIFNAVTASAPDNDWVIAPLTQIIAGDQVSFWARSGTDAAYADEKLQLLVSTTGTAPADFTAVSAIFTTTQTWTQFSADLSAYAGQEVYVAIQCTSNDQYFVCIDDFSIGQAVKKSKVLESYTVYLDGVSVATGVTATNYNFTNLASGDHTAGVKSVYTTGETSVITVPFTIVAGADYTFTVVDDAVTPAAVEGANVNVGGFDILTDVTGTASQFLAPGTYTYTVSKFGYTDATGDVTVVDGVIATIPVTLPLKPAVEVTFTVENILATPLAGAAIEIMSGTLVVGNGTTNASGVYVDNLPAGPYTFTATLAGYATFSGNFTVAAAALPVPVEMLENLDQVVGLTFVTGSNATINWLAPGSSVITPTWIHYDNEAAAASANALGLTNGGEMWVASYFPAADLTQYQGGVISKVKFFAGSDAGTSVFTIKIWTGTGITESYSETVSSYTLDAWNEVVLATPYTFDITEDLYIGYSVVHIAGEYPAGMDAGPAVVGFGDKASMDNGATWVNVSDYGFGNWSLQGYVDAPAKKGFLSTYEVYLDGVLKTPAPITALTYTFPTLPTGTYMAGVKALYTTGASAMKEVVIDIPSSVEELAARGISVYPNPSTGLFNVNVNENYNMQVIDVTGKVIKSQQLTGNTNVQLNKGVYFLRFSNNSKIISTTIVVK